MENSELMVAACDGIRTNDNPVPAWWKRIYIGTAFFSVCYGGYFLVGAPGRSTVELYEAAAAIESARQLDRIGELEPNAATLSAYASHASKKGMLRIGQATFKKNCATCHGRNAEGKIGPNLTDEHFKNVRKIEDLVQVLEKGAGNGAMPAWGEKLSKNEIVLLAAYVASLRGSDAPDGKGPEGSQIAPWPAVPEDATKTVDSKQDSQG